MTLGGFLLLATIIAMAVGFVKLKEQGEKISRLEKKISGKKSE